MKVKGLFTGIFLLTLCSLSTFGYVLDLRTKLDEKVQLAPIKNGALYYLSQEGHTIFEISEDYAVWLKDYEKKERNNGTIVISLTVTLTEPTSFQEKEALAEKRITFSYNPGRPETMTTDETATRFIRKKIVRSSGKIEAEATIGGQAVADAVTAMLRRLR